MIDILAKHGAYLSSTDVHNACPLHYVSQMCGAAEEDDGQYHAASLSLLQKLICKKALVDVLDLDLRTPLFWAASAGICRIIFIIELNAKQTSFRML